MTFRVRTYRTEGQEYLAGFKVKGRLVSTAIEVSRPFLLFTLPYWSSYRIVTKLFIRLNHLLLVPALSPGEWQGLWKSYRSSCALWYLLGADVDCPVFTAGWTSNLDTDLEGWFLLCPVVHIVLYTGLKKKSEVDALHIIYIKKSRRSLKALLCIFFQSQRDSCSS